MPLVAHSSLPTFDRLRERGEEVLPLDRALHQDIRELHIGLLNMMPDAALQVTERQFMRLIGNCNQIAQFYVHVFSVPGLPRSPETLAYIEKYYTTFANVRAEGLDALIITGANITQPNLEDEPFWEPLLEVFAWGTENVTSILCSCLATHALLKYYHQLDRERLPHKQWGVFNHHIVSADHHPLLRYINTRFDVPHSRWNQISRKQMESADLKILVESEVAGVHVATSPDQFRIIYFQGHPEYSRDSLLKEYRRELFRYLHGELEELPPYPDNYFNHAVSEIIEQYIEQAILALQHGEPLPHFPEERISPLLDNTWGDTAKAIFNNWLGLVYKLTSLDRSKQFMEWVDPDDPLGLKHKQFKQGDQTDA